VTDRKAMVVRLVEEVMNDRDLDLLDELWTPQLAPKLRTAFGSFAAAFPDWHQELVELVAEDDTVVARFRCHGTQTGGWEGLPASGRAMTIDEVYFFRFAGENVTLGELGSLSDPTVD